MFYARNTFELCITKSFAMQVLSFGHLFKWLYSIGFENRQLVQKVVICTYAPEDFIPDFFKECCDGRRKRIGCAPGLLACYWEGEIEDEFDAMCEANTRCGACYKHYRIRT